MRYYAQRQNPECLEMQRTRKVRVEAEKSERNPSSFAKPRKQEKSANPSESRQVGSCRTTPLELSAIKRMRKNVDALIIAKLFVRSIDDGITDNRKVAEARMQPKPTVGVPHYPLQFVFANRAR